MYNLDKKFCPHLRTTIFRNQLQTTNLKASLNAKEFLPEPRSQVAIMSMFRKCSVFHSPKMPRLCPITRLDSNWKIFPNFTLPATRNTSSFFSNHVHTSEFLQKTYRLFTLIIVSFLISTQNGIILT